MGKCDWEGHKQNMTEANRAKGPENVRRKDRSSIIRQAVLALLLCSVAALVACTPVKEPERKEKTVLQLWHYWDQKESRQCLAKLVQKFNHFCEKTRMNIEGLSATTLEKFIGHGWIRNFGDLYDLEKHREDIINTEGFGVKSYERLQACI